MFSCKVIICHDLLFFNQNVVILCGTNNVQRDSSKDIADGILEIPPTSRRKYHHLNIVVFELIKFK